MVCSTYEKLECRVEAGIAYVATIWIPKQPLGFAAACIGGWYGRQVAVGYAPGLVAHYFKESAVAYMGSASVGAAVNASVIAPVASQIIVPYLVDFIGFIAFALVGIICNLAAQRFGWPRGENPT